MKLKYDENGLLVKGSANLKRMELSCDHHQGTFYFTQSDSNWVCSNKQVVAHSLNGFFKDLNEMEDQRVKELLQKWGIYHRIKS